MPDLTPRALAQAQARQEREASALRENLRRRKAQRRAKETEAHLPHEPSPDPKQEGGVE